MARTPARSAVDRFYASLSLRSRIKLYAAIFFLLAPVGLFSSWKSPEDRPFTVILAHVVLSGLASVGWAAASIHNLRLLFVIIPVHAFSFLALERFNPTTPGAVGALGMVVLALGYVLFIQFISGEGVSKLKLQAEIALAQGIHRDLVPPIALSGPRLELYGRSAASSAVGGDLIDAVEQEGRTVLCVADVAGHGVHAGVVMGMVKSALRTQLLRNDRDGSPLAEVDQVLKGILRPGMFVTCVTVAVSEAVSAYANAGHLPLLRHDARSGRIERLSESGLPLAAGVQPRRSTTPGRDWHPFEFLPGDLLVLVTDGFTEVIDRAGNEFGLEPIEAIVLADPQAPLRELYERIEQAARDHGPQVDDQTMLLVRRMGA